MLAEIETMQTRLLASEAKLIRAEKVAGFGHWEFDMETRMVTASVGARMIYGMEERDYTIPEIQAIPLPEYRGYLDTALHDLIERGTPYNVEFLIRRPDNDRIVAIRSIAEYDPESRSVFGVIQYITLQKLSEREVRESGERYRSLMESIPELVLVHRDGTILYANEALVRAVAIPREELIGSPAFRFIAPESMAMIMQMIQLRKDGGSFGPFEAVFITSNNERRHGRVNTAPILYGGEPASLVIITDITSRKIMEETLSTANKKLRMLASITRHDIRNKILGLRAYLAIGMESAKDDTERSRLRQMDDIARTIDEQIEFTREYQTMGVHEPQWIPVGMTIVRVTGQLDPKGIAIHDDTGSLELWADPLLGKVFYNLTDNAIRHGDTITEIRIRCEEKDDRLVLFFEDNGPGIPPEDKLEIFERGFGKNTGLGLFMIREILAITGITISETGIFGKGARFEMLVPDGKFRFRADEQPEKTDVR
jgi:PAS domain S-box-containing protein